MNRFFFWGVVLCSFAAGAWPAGTPQPQGPWVLPPASAEVREEAAAAKARLAASTTIKCLVGHRGDSESFPENTMPAFLSAREKGFNIETDVYMTRDGVVFLTHDQRINRKDSGLPPGIWATNTGWKGQLEHADAGAWMGEKWKGTKYPRIGELLALARDGQFIILEIKDPRKDLILPAIKKEIERFPNVNPGNVYFQGAGSGLRKVLPGYRDISCSLAREKPAISSKPLDLMARARKMDPGRYAVWSLRWDEELVTRELVDLLHSRGLKIGVWTVNDADSAWAALGRGVDWICTDRPAALANEMGLSGGPAADFTVERRVLARFADRTGDAGRVVFREGGDAARAEGFAIHDDAGRIVIESPTRRGRLYGLGHHLREPAFRGSDAPVQRVRGIYFATHFGNWYDTASEDELRDYVEDLSLWGCNQVRVWFDMHDLTGTEDPRAAEKARRLKKILALARACGLEPSLLVLANEAFAGSPENLRADWRGGQNGYARELRGHYHVEICPSRPGGLERILKERAAVLDLFADVSVGNVCIFPYDQGGCTCRDCAPWGANGLFKVLPPLSALIRGRMPGCRIEVGTWYFDHFGELGEWKGFCARADEVRHCADLLSVERLEWLRDGNPVGLPATSMAEISMWRMLPWGGFGANPCPKRLSAYAQKGAGTLAGFRPYSEGIYEDLNKVLFLRLGWTPSASWREIVRAYAAFHFGGTDDAVAEAVSLLEDAQSHEAKVVQDGRRHSLYSCADVAAERPFEIAFTGRRPDPAKAVRALSLLTAYEAKMPEPFRRQWRWRILKLRAVVDARLAEGAELADSDLRAAFDELAEIYHVGGLTEPFLTPPGSRLRPGSHRAGAL